MIATQIGSASTHSPFYDDQVRSIHIPSHDIESKQANDLKKSEFEPGLNVQFGKQDVNYLINSKLVEHLKDLKAHISPLLKSNSQNLYNNQTLFFDQKDIFGGNLHKVLPRKNYNLQLISEARPTKIISDYLKNNERDHLENGEYVIGLRYKNQDHTMHFNVDESDTHESILKVIGVGINQLYIDVDASLESTGLTDMSRLHLKSLKTGAGENFQLQDIKGSLLDNLGLLTNRLANDMHGGLISIAQDATMLVDKAVVTSSTNVFHIEEDALDIEVIHPDNKEVKATVEPDFPTILRALNDLITAFNDNVKISVSLGTEDTSKVYSQLAKASLENREKLQQFGIYPNNFGVLEINPQEVATGVFKNFDEAADFFGGEEGFFNQLNKVIETFIQEESENPEMNNESSVDLYNKVLQEQEKEKFVYNFLGQMKPQNPRMFSSLI